MEINRDRQLTTNELKIRQMAQEYLKIQENTEYLTNLVRYSHGKKRVMVNLSLIAFDFKSIALLTVQFSYFLFTCCLKRMNVYISKTMILRNPSRKEEKPELCCEYILQKDLLQLKQEEQKYLKRQFTMHEFSTNSHRAYGQYVLHYVDKMLALVLPQTQKAQLKQEKTISNQFLQLQMITNTFIKPKIQTIQNPRIIILSLEQSQLFRQHSTLVKIMNNSIFLSIRNSREKYLFNEICRYQNNLIAINHKVQIEKKGKEIEESIQNIFKILTTSKILRVRHSIFDKSENSVSSQNKKPIVSSSLTNPYSIGYITGTSIKDRKYTCNFKILQKLMQQFSPQLYEKIIFQSMNNYTSQIQSEDNNINLEDTENVPFNEYVVQYMASKSILSVKYITTIQLNNQNTDMIMFQCNNVAFHWSNISIEHYEKSTNLGQKKNQKFIALKTMAHMSLNERPITKLLLMIDFVMMCAKIAEPELIRKNKVKQQNYNKIQQASKGIEHMIRLFLKKVQKYYIKIAQSQKNKVK